MTDKSEWQEANRRLMAEQRRELGEPPTAEEMLAYSRGELTEAEEERIRELLVAYPELARAYSAPFPEEPRAGDPDAVPDDKTSRAWSDLQRRLGTAPVRREAVRFRQYVPTTIAAAVALVFFGLYVQAETRARQYKERRQPVVLGAPQELEPDGSRGPAAANTLRKDGEAYLLEPRLINQVHYPNYRIDLYHHSSTRPMWTSSSAQPNEDDTFRIVIPHDFFHAGQRYQLRISGVDGQTPTLLGTFDVATPAE